MGFGVKPIPWLAKFIDPAAFYWSGTELSSKNQNATGRPKRWLSCKEPLHVPFILRRDHPAFEDLDPRAELGIKRLQNPDQSIGFQAALVELRLNWDLLVDESALKKLPRQLQVRIIELAATHDQAWRMAVGMISESPLTQVFFCIIAQAMNHDCRHVRIVFSNDSQLWHRAFYDLPTGETESITLPYQLGASLRGFTPLAEASGCDRTRPYLGFKVPTAEQIAFHWSDSSTLKLTIN